ncbi:hypothetical protein QVD17_01166 [Tagetes erecta]|uniref:Uncharacterized protein n=1 Tax=Tagetes erecta TaxID=13708 RepID=A0AAD8L6I7_TARER|nr:hypothetical protein QVD17_01166 [Tagetes erecta]
MFLYIREQGVVRRGGKRGGGEDARGRGWLLVVELGGGRKVRGRDVARRRWDEKQRGWPLLRRGEDKVMGFWEMLLSRGAAWRLENIYIVGV